MGLRRLSNNLILARKAKQWAILWSNIGLYSDHFSRFFASLGQETACSTSHPRTCSSPKHAPQEQEEELGDSKTAPPHQEVDMGYIPSVSRSKKSAGGAAKVVGRTALFLLTKPPLVQAKRATVHMVSKPSTRSYRIQKPHLLWATSQVKRRFDVFFALLLLLFIYGFVDVVLIF